MSRRIRVGIGGWNFAPWRGSFYPKGLPQSKELPYASGEVTSIEINSTFYGAQKPATFRKWRESTPDDFVFAVKAPMFATHRKRLSEGATSMKRFMEGGVLELGEKLGPINWQLAPTKRFDAVETEEFLSLLPRKAGATSLRHAIEVRHESFDCRAFTTLAKRYGVAVVEAGDSAYPHLQANTASFRYLRLMGTRKGEPAGYPARALGRWRAYVTKLGARQEVFVYFISGAKERNPHAARALLARLGAGRATG